jgi:hypothetical protein
MVEYMCNPSHYSGGRDGGYSWKFVSRSEANLGVSETPSQQTSWMWFTPIIPVM